MRSHFHNWIDYNGCLVPRRLSLDENVRAKEDGLETTGERPSKRPSVCTLPMVLCGSSPVARLYLAKNEGPDEEAVIMGLQFQ